MGDFDTYQKSNNGRPDVAFMRNVGSPQQYQPEDGAVAASEMRLGLCGVLCALAGLRGSLLDLFRSLRQ